MRKITVFLLLFILFVPVARAATMRSDYTSDISQKATYTLAPIVITATADEITKEHGMTVFLDPDRRILWNRDASISAAGSAVEAGHVAGMPEVSYSDDYKAVHIGVLGDLLEGEFFTLTGLAVRTYDREFSNRFLMMDLDGDDLPDVTDLNAYKVNSSARTDQAIPYPVTNLTYEISPEKDKVTLNWVNPPDYDVSGITIIKEVIRNGKKEVPSTILSNLYTTFLNDIDVKEGDEITYRIYARDQRNNGEEVELTILVADQEEEVVPEEEMTEEEPEPESEPVDTTPVSETERASLTRFFNYYRVRYSIKCLPSGVPVAEGNSACLWAKIDLAYAQNRLNRDEVAVDLSQRNLDIIESRLRFSGDRYQQNCAETNDPAAYCSALGKALERARYFLD